MISATPCDTASSRPSTPRLLAAPLERIVLWRRRAHDRCPSRSRPIHGAAIDARRREPQGADAVPAWRGWQPLAGRHRASPRRGASTSARGGAGLRRGQDANKMFRSRREAGELHPARRVALRRLCAGGEACNTARLPRGRARTGAIWRPGATAPREADPFAPRWWTATRGRTWPTRWPRPRQADANGSVYEIDVGGKAWRCGWNGPSSMKFATARCRAGASGRGRGRPRGLPNLKLRSGTAGAAGRFQRNRGGAASV